MTQPGRKFSLGGYRYGFNGKENDNEVKGEGNQQDYGMRIYDPRLGKFLSVDPITKNYPDLTPFQFASNTPLWAVDMDGLEGLISTGIGTGHIVSSNNARKISNEIRKIHLQGINKVEVAQQAKEQAIIQGRRDGDGINWLILGAVYIAAWWDRIAPLSDANDGAVLLRGKNLDGSNASIGDYTAAGIGTFVPFLSGSALKKTGSALIEGTISVFRNGKEIKEAAYKIGKYGHEGTREYNSVLNAIKSGGNIVASSEEEAMKFLKEAMPGIGDETGKQASKFGYRIDNFIDGSKDGLKQGHQGRHVNYYDKENKVKGTILIEGARK
jgi:RHS repeat-associated protein